MDSVNVVLTRSVSAAILSASNLSSKFLIRIVLSADTVLITGV